MKNRITKRSIWIAIGLLTLLSVTSAHAETKLLRVEIPFKFVAADQVLPAGVYRVVIDTQFNRMELRRIDGVAGAYISVHSASRPTPVELGQLLFHGYGHAYFLRSVWGAGRSIGSELSQSKAEREMVRAASSRTHIARVRILTK